MGFIAGVYVVGNYVPSTLLAGPIGSGNHKGYQVGLRFSTKQAGLLTAVRLPGVRTEPERLITVWGQDGSRLATARTRTAAGSTAPTASLTRPVALKTNDKYLVTYWHPSRDTPDFSGVPAIERHSAITVDAFLLSRGEGFPRGTTQSDTGIDLTFVPTSGQSPDGRPVPSRWWPRPTPSPSDSTTPTGPASVSPSPSVSSSVSGGCGGDPGRCGFPDAVSTGVREGVVLREVPSQVSSGPGWEYDPRGWVRVHGVGAVLEGLHIRSTVEVTADDVTIRDCRLSLGGDNFLLALRHTHGVRIEHNDIGPQSIDNRVGAAIKDIYGDAKATTVLANDIRHAATGIQLEAGLIQDNYVHDFGHSDGDHLNGTTSNNGTTQLTITHNTILNQHSQTDAISLFQDFGPQANRTIDNNLLAGGSYTIYAGADPEGQTTTNIRITNNRISRLYYPHGGEYGPLTAYEPHGPGNTFTNNTWDDTGKPI
ncbi:MAG: hypothetical protein QG608_3147, partial [Actinomycetota bacterium]|nr:hypothetical protein [Actinomycetota bacterium]